MEPQARNEVRERGQGRGGEKTMEEAESWVGAAWSQRQRPRLIDKERGAVSRRRVLVPGRGGKGRRHKAEMGQMGLGWQGKQ